MMPRFQRLCRSAAAALLVGAAAALAAPAPEDPVEKTQTEAYLAVIEADSARDLEEWRDAIRWYRNATALYEAIRRSDPEWHPDVVQYRLSYCANEIAWILQETGKTEKQILAGLEEPPAVPTNATAAVNQALTKENELLQEEIDRLRLELQERPVADTWEAEIRRWRDEAAASQAQLVAMSNQLAKAVSPSARELKELKQKNEALSDELKTVRKRETELKEAADRQASELKDKAELRLRAEQLAKETEALAEKAALERKDAAKRIEELQAKLDRQVAELKKADELRAKNEALSREKEALGAEMEKARDGLAQAQKRAAALLETIDLQAVELKKLEELRAKNGLLSEEKEKLGDEIGKARLDLAQSQKRVAALLESIDRQAAELKKVDELKARIRQLTEDKEKLYRDMKRAADDYAKLSDENRVKKLEELVGKLRADVKIADARAEMLQDQLYKTQEKVTALEKENARLTRK